MLEALSWLYGSEADSLSIAESVEAVAPCLNDDAARELRSFLIEHLESDSPSEYHRWVRALLALLPHIHDDQRDHLRGYFSTSRGSLTPFPALRHSLDFCHSSQKSTEARMGVG